MNDKLKKCITYLFSICALSGISALIVIQFKAAAGGASAEEISKFLNNDAICKIANTPFDSEHAVSLLSGTKNELVEKLHAALANAGLLTKSEQVAPNFSAAVNELRELRSVDTGNGIYDFFLAYCLQESGAPISDVHKSLEAAFAAPRVEFHSDALDLKMLERSFSTASYRFLYLRLKESAPQIQYSRLSRLIFFHLYNSDAAFNKSAIDFAQKLIPKNVKTDQFPDLYDWERLRYSIAVRTIGQAWPKAYPDREAPNYLIRRNAVIAETSKQSVPQQALSNLIKSSDNFYTCDREKFDAWYTEQKIQFNSREF